MSLQTYVLVVEDEALIAFALKGKLEEAGWIPVCFARCDEAEQWLCSNQPDAAIVDVIIDGRPCSDLAAAIIRKGIPFVILSGYTRIEGNFSPVFQDVPWFEKPADLRKMIDHMRSMMERPISEGPSSLHASS